MSFQKVLVANRGEIAVRVIRTCRDLGIQSVAVYTEADRGAMHVRIADETVQVLGPSASQGYLDAEQLVSIARKFGVDAVHPGYGFLAENSEFASAVEAAGMVFVGPPSKAIEVMGEKIAARRLATEVGVHHVPGTASPVTSAADVEAFGAEHGYPLIIKAALGGGGRGMRIVRASDDADEALEAARREAVAGFASDSVYVERYLESARHIEVQILADGHGHVVWLGDRDCSVQRRHQKLIEEAPAPGLSPELRGDMGEAAVRLARAVEYVGAGTVEFLVDDDRFYFLEMNTRIQVEHPVTEATLGLDLVAEQLRIADGERMTIDRSGPSPRGHAIECRINAEVTSGRQFVPAPGTIVRLEMPSGPGVRVDLGYEAGDEIPPYYDSMIGKLIVWAPDREMAIRRMAETLDRLVIMGVPTTCAAARTIVTHPDFLAGQVHTRWLETEIAFDEPNPAPIIDGEGVTTNGEEVWVGGRRYAVPNHRLPVEVATREGASRAGRGRTSARASSPRTAPAAGSGQVLSPMQGTVIELRVTEGDLVEKGDVVCVVEAMKMENPVRAEITGRIGEVAVSVGDTVPAGARITEVVSETSKA